MRDDAAGMRAGAGGHPGAGIAHGHEVARPGRRTAVEDLAARGGGFARGAGVGDGTDLEAQLAEVEHQLAILRAANSAGDAIASGDARRRLGAALRAAGAGAATASAEAAFAPAARLAQLRGEAHDAISLAFTPSPAAIREATSGSGRLTWDREVAAWRAARGHGEAGGSAGAAPAAPTALPSLQLGARGGASPAPTPPRPNASAAPAPERLLPSWMMVVTLLDASGGYIAARTEPLHGDAPGGAFFGHIRGTAIDWKRGAAAGEEVVTISPRVGVQYDAKGRITNPGIPLEQWIAAAGRGRARMVVVEIEPARLLDEDHGGRGREGTAPRPPPTRAGRGTAGETPSAAAGASAAASTEPGGEGGDARHAGPAGPGDAPGRDARYPGADSVGRPGGATRGHERGSVGGRDHGSVHGRRDGTRTRTGFLDDPRAPGRGTNDVTMPDASADGMVGGTGEAGDRGVPGTSGLLPLLTVPRNIAPAVAVGLILIEADLAGWTDRVVKLAFKLGPRAAARGGGFGKLVAAKFDRYVDGEVAKVAEVLAQHPHFAMKTADEQAALLREIREAIAAETHAKLSAKLDQKIADGERWAEEAAERADRFTDDTVRESIDYAEAARAAKDALPPRANRRNASSTAHANAPGSRPVSGAARERRLAELSRDPDHNGFVTAGSPREAEVMLALEEAGRVPAPVRRRANGDGHTGDFVDGANRDWDIKAPRSRATVIKELEERARASGKKQHLSASRGVRGEFSAPKFAEEIADEIATGERIVIDTRGLVPEDVKLLKRELGKRGLDREVIYYE